MLGTNETILDTFNPKELATLSYEHGTLVSVRAAQAVATAYKELSKNDGLDEASLYLFTIGAIFDAGRVHGMREERAKK